LRRAAIGSKSRLSVSRFDSEWGLFVSDRRQERSVEGLGFSQRGEKMKLAVAIVLAVVLLPLAVAVRVVSVLVEFPLRVVHAFFRFGANLSGSFIRSFVEGLAEGRKRRDKEDKILASVSRREVN
jgi:hypothetical protein